MQHHPKICTPSSGKKFWFLPPLILLALCTALVSCSYDMPAPLRIGIDVPPNTFIINDTPQVVENDVLLLTATIEPQNSFGQQVEWSSSNKDIATVDPATGLVTGIAEGQVVITATSLEIPDLKASISLQVPGPNTILAFSIAGLEGVRPILTDNTVVFEIDFNKEGRALNVANLITTVTHNGDDISTPSGTLARVTSTIEVTENFTGGPVVYTVSGAQGEPRTYQVSVKTKLGTEFITTWNTAEINIPTNPDFTYNYNVDTNDDGFIDQTGLAENASVSFSGSGRTLRISGQFPAIFFNNGSERNKIESLTQWGTVAWESMRNAFFRCSNLEVPATDVPDLSKVTDMSGMFAFAVNANPEVRNWDTHSVTDMSVMFVEARNANPDVQNWDTRNVTNMSGMFLLAVLATPDVRNWDTGSVTNMSVMFNGAFNANPDVRNWDTRSVTSMRSMFSGTNNANPDVRKWDTRNVTDMSDMFSDAENADPDLSGWNISKVTDMENIFDRSKLSRENYEKALIRFAEHATPGNGLTLPTGIDLDDVPVSFCSPEAQEAANTLEANAWIIPPKANDCEE